MKSLVLLSGGQDSATCLAIALSECKSVEAISFDYGQRHKIELDCAQKLAKKTGVPWRLVDLGGVADLSQNALTDPTQAIEAKPGELPSTFVPGRNLLFLSVAASYAYQRGIRVLYAGVCQTDYSGYPDCREAFIRSAEKSLSLALDTPFEIRTPLMHLTKAETVLKMKQLGKLALYAETHTCYEGQRPPCGHCPACVLRAKGFAEAGVTDPLIY